MSLGDFLHMGGYAGYVWTAYGLTMMVLALNWVSATSPTNFTIQRATNLGFTTGLNTTTPAGGARSATQNLASNTTYYFRIRANNPNGSSVWIALPLPVPVP
jgi:hypothetical protein